MASNPERVPLYEARVKAARIADQYLAEARLASASPAHEPVMPMVPFIAKDALSIDVLEFYLGRLRQVRPERHPYDPRQPHPIEVQVAALLAEFYRWQAEHPEDVKLPD